MALLAKVVLFALLCVLGGVKAASHLPREEYLKQLCIDCEDSEETGAPEDECYRYCWSTGNKPVNHVPSVPQNQQPPHMPSQDYIDQLCRACNAEDSMAPEDECMRWCPAQSNTPAAIVLSKCEECKKTGRQCTKKCRREKNSSKKGGRKPRSVPKELPSPKFNVSEHVKQHASEALKNCLEDVVDSACELIFAYEIIHKTEDPREFFAVKQAVCENCNEPLVFVPYGLCFTYCHFDGYTFNITSTKPANSSA